jgi:hypothetical protein
MKKVKGPITKAWIEARLFINENKLDQAEDALDKGIAMIAQTQVIGVRDKDLIEGVKREVWLERFWVATEKYIWPTRPDYEQNWKCS